jgi:hypothetical protein
VHDGTERALYRDVIGWVMGGMIGVEVGIEMYLIDLLYI